MFVSGLDEVLVCVRSFKVMGLSEIQPVDILLHFGHKPTRTLSAPNKDANYCEKTEISVPSNRATREMTVKTTAVRKSNHCPNQTIQPQIKGWTRNRVCLNSKGVDLRGSYAFP